MWFATEVFRRHPNVPESGCENARTGSWGEDVVACFLRNRGWKIVGRRVRPCRRDRRCEIDMIARLPDRQTVVFVEVKTHAARSAQEERVVARLRELADVEEVAREFSFRRH